MFNFVQCKICKGTLICHNTRHIARHGMSVEEYLHYHKDLKLEDIDNINFKNVMPFEGAVKVAKEIEDMRERRFFLHSQGFTDDQMAKVEGRSKKGIASYRRDYLKLPPN